MLRNDRISVIIYRSIVLSKSRKSLQNKELALRTILRFVYLQCSIFLRHAFVSVSKRLKHESFATLADDYRSWFNSQPSSFGFFHASSSSQSLQYSWSLFEWLNSLFSILVLDCKLQGPSIIRSADQ